MGVFFGCCLFVLVFFLVFLFFLFLVLGQLLEAANSVSYEQFSDFIFGYRGSPKDEITITNEISRCKLVLSLKTWQLLVQRRNRKGNSVVNGDSEHLDQTPQKNEAGILRNALVARGTAHGQFKWEREFKVVFTLGKKPW